MASISEQQASPAPAMMATSPLHAMTGIGALIRDFTGVAGRGGLAAIGYVIAAALLEAFGFSLLIPLLGVVFGTPPNNAIGSAARFVFTLFGSQAAFYRLLLLLSLFAVLMGLRAIASNT